MTSLIRVKKFDNVIHNINEFIMITIYANDELFNDILIIAKMIIKIHLIDNLKINMLIDNNVLMSQKIKFDFVNDKIIINVYQNLAIKIKIVIKKDFEICRIIRTKRTVIISTLSIMLMLITYRDTLLKNKDFLFES